MNDLELAEQVRSIVPHRLKVFLNLYDTLGGQLIPQEDDEDWKKEKFFFFHIIFFKIQCFGLKFFIFKDIILIIALFKPLVFSFCLKSSEMNGRVFFYYSKLILLSCLNFWTM